MIFRHSNISDFQSISQIIADAQQSLAALGIDQWQDGYPEKEILLNDITAKNGYILENEGNIAAIATVVFNYEPTYDYIDGAWQTNSDFAVVHRLAVAKNIRRSGAAKLIMKNIENLCRKKNIHSIKIDTHKGNIPMQHLIKSLCYTYCGIIFLETGKERLAFEKIIK